MVTYKAARFRRAKAAQALARARQIVRKRNSGLTNPVGTRGFYGLYTRRGRNELKVIDTNTALTPFAATGALQLINGCAIGTDYTDRVGRKIFLKSLYMKIFIYPTITTNSQNGTTSRCLVVYDTQTNGAAPAVTDILQTNTYDAPINLSNRDRFKVLYNKYVFTPAFVYTAASLTAGDPIPRLFHCYKKLNLDTIFSGTGATVGSIATGSIYVLLQSNNDQTTSADGWFRIRFADA